MRRTVLIIATGLLAAMLAAPALAAANDPAPDQPISCGNGIPGGVNCIATKSQIKEARSAFTRGRKLADRKQLEEAYSEFDNAARLVPQNPQFLTARELVKAKLVFNHVERGNVLLLENLRARAAEEFRAALDLDPENQFVQERFKEAVREEAADAPAVLPVQLADAGEIHIQPRDDRATFHFTGDVRSLFAQLAPAYGVTVQFDDSVQNRQVRFNVEDVDFFTALKLACEISKTMWAALDTRQLLIAADNPENHKQFDRMSLQTFTLPSHSTAQEASEVVNTLRVLFDLRFVSPGQTADTLEVRGPQPILKACSQLMEQLRNGRPQVGLDVRIFQISHQLTRNIGVHVPNTFNLYNIPAAALVGLAGQNIQQLINQLISSGGINQAGSSALSGLLAQLEGQQNSIFSQPLATFGGGLTFMGLSLDQLTTALSVNESWARSLEHMTIRADQGSDATFHVGERYPIQNASYAPIYNSPQISQVLGNQSYIAPFPSVSYEDIGLNMKAKPAVHGDGSVSLQLDIEVRSLTGQSNNGVPIMSNREYQASINLKDGEPAVVAGAISRTDSLAMSGIPGLGFLPGLNQAMVNNTKEEDSDELMIVITPHILADIDRITPEIWMSQN
ncbi:MAG: hypothetical protein ABSE40_15965 [Candidatus Sulfotelmatobacter sp.]|jgi:Flp pilus assembly secretin CpaC/tetratricopeptide (TPR) repeat protein